MPNRPDGGAPIIGRAYDLCAELYEHVDRFPRAQRTLLGRVILDEGLRMLTALTLANRLADKREALAQASGHLDALRITLRLAKRLGFLSNRGYESLTAWAGEAGAGRARRPRSLLTAPGRHRSHDGEPARRALPRRQASPSDRARAGRGRCLLPGLLRGCAALGSRARPAAGFPLRVTSTWSRSSAMSLSNLLRLLRSSRTGTVLANSEKCTRLRTSAAT